MPFDAEFYSEQPKPKEDPYLKRLEEEKARQEKAADTGGLKGFLKGIYSGGTSKMIAEGHRGQALKLEGKIREVKEDITSDDPTSDSSKAAQAIVKSVMPNSTLDFSKFSEKQLTKWAPNITQFIKMQNEMQDKQARDADRDENRELRKAQIAALGDERKTKHKQEALDEFKKDKLILKYQEKADMAKNARSLAAEAKTNPTAAAAMLRSLARASGEVGVLTDQDVAAFGGSQAIIAKMQRAAEKAASGKLPQADLAFILQLTNAMEKASRANIISRGRELARQVSQTNKEFTEKELHGLYGVGEENKGVTTSSGFTLKR